MDTGKGEFVEFEYERLPEMQEKYPKHKGIFWKGKELEIEGSRFVVKDISPFGIKLKLLPAKK